MQTMSGTDSRVEAASVIAAYNPTESAYGSFVDESTLIEACKQGDRAAWDTLFTRYRKPIYRFAYSLSGNRDDADDITAQVFLRLYKHIHTFRSSPSFTSWLFRMVSNVHIDTCVRAPHRAFEGPGSGMRTVGGTYIADIPDTSPTPEAACLEAEKSLMLRSAVKNLPRYQRIVVDMYHLEGCSYQEIADRTRLSVGTVKSRLWRARQALNERLSPLEKVLTSDHFEKHHQSRKP
jgi:RNA polymerase sigma-70 factor (ECF subfamily)